MDVGENSIAGLDCQMLVWYGGAVLKKDKNPCYLVIFIAVLLGDFR